MKNKSAILLGVLAASITLAHAEPKLVYVTQTNPGRDGKPVRTKLLAGLMDMADPMMGPGSGCSPFVGQVKVEGVQFSASGAVLESFRFTNPKGDQWSIPTGIGDLSNADKGAANSFIKVGKKYLVHAKVCGSGGFPELINMYDLSVQFKP